ncbi:MAG: hypothetical protein ACYCZR_05040 [Burkholderiales bacterium]
MTDYPLIDPADVIASDEIEVTYRVSVNDGLRPRDIGIIVDRSTIFGEPVTGTTVRLVHRPAPPEPALRVGDWVRDMFNMEFQLTDPYLMKMSPSWAKSLTRAEPPVGWPVAVPDPDAPGGVRWYTRTFMGDKYHRYHAAEKKAVFDIGWTDLVAVGGIPALAPEGNK